jgi:hypothetical protein
MRTENFSFSKSKTLILLIILFSCVQLKSRAQTDRSVTVYQYRRVPADKVDEFVKRETTYWSKVAEHAVKNKTMTFWALLEKQGEYDMENSSNYLFINTFPDIDKVGEVFGSPEKITGVPLAKMETNSMSTTTTQLFVHEEDWQQVASANPPKDFNYVVMIYHNTNYPDSLIGLEKKYWSPFIKKTMDNKQTPQVAWGNAVVLSPSGDNIKFNTISYDLYKTLQDALMPNMNGNIDFPDEGLGKINAIELNRRGSVVYRVVKVVAAQ